MKKVLLASTALVAMSGAAFAGAHTDGVSVSGTAGIWLQDNGVDDVMVNYDLNLSFSAEGTTDGGLTMGLDYTTLEDGTVDNTEVFMSGAFGKLTVGDVDDALQMAAGMGDIGYDGIGIDNVAEVARGAGDASGVLYSYSADAFAVDLSHNMVTAFDDIAVGVTASFGGFGIGIGYEDTDATGGTVAADLSGSFGDASVAVYYEDSDLGSGYGLEIGYDMGDVGLSLAYADHDAAADAAVGIGMSYDLGGATLAAGVGDAGGETVWDLGVSMDF